MPIYIPMKCNTNKKYRRTKMTKKNLLLILFTSLLFSCGTNTTRQTEEEQKTEQNEKEKKKIIDKLVSKYNITYKWDTLKYEFSINYKPVMNSRYQLIDDIYVIDIYEKDSNEYALIKTGRFPKFHTTLFNNFYFDLLITKEQEEFFDNDNDIILVVNIAEIEKMKPSCQIKIEDREIHLDKYVHFIGRGKTIDIVSIK